MAREIRKLIPGTKFRYKLDYMFTCDKHKLLHYDWECPVCKALDNCLLLKQS